MRILVCCALLAVALACEFKGKKLQHGEYYVDQNAFKLRCVINPNGSWRMETTHCLTPDGREIPVNSTVTHNNYDWTCSGTGNRISLRQENSKYGDCGAGHPYGSEWMEKAFKFRCDEMSTRTFLGCQHPQAGFIPSGQTREHSGFNIGCFYNANNGTVSMNATPIQDGSCRDATNAKRSKGEEWVENEHFIKSCGTNGLAVVVGCQLPSSNEKIPLNSSVTRRGITYHCEGTDGSYRFYTKVTGAQ